MPYARENVKTNMIDTIINNNGSNVKQLEDEEFSKNTFLPFNTNKGVRFKSYAQALTRYGSLFTYKYSIKEGVWVYDELTPQQTLIIIRLWDNLKYEGSAVTQLDLSRAARCNISYVSTLIKRMLNGKFICPFCEEEFPILILGEPYRYTVEGAPGNSYKLDGLISYISHLNLVHENPNPKEFWADVSRIEANKEKKNMNRNSLVNLPTVQS